MPPVLFLQSETGDPYAWYLSMQQKNPVYWDDSVKTWAIYSYKACVVVLADKAAHIPLINKDNKDGLNEYALLITGSLARLSNSNQHTISREIALVMFSNLKAISIAALVEKLLQQDSHNNETDWVNAVCKKLPVLAVLKSFAFSDTDADCILEKMDRLVKIMQPLKTSEEVNDINNISKEIYSITEQQLLTSGLHQAVIKPMKEKHGFVPDEWLTAGVSNLVGLFIQAYDAGRGLLSNSLLQVLKNNIATAGFADKAVIKKIVVETLRFDPPVQHTKRVAVENIMLGNIEIKKNESILLLLASANRDPQQFSRPEQFDIERFNNHEHLTFGFGHHQCVANHFSVYLATETLCYFFARYKNPVLVEKKIAYEPLSNVRLPKQLLISGS